MEAPAALLVIPFVHPSLAWAALALGALPIIIHLINRRRYVRVPWAAMEFLLAARRKSAARVRMEQWLLMLIRVAAIVLLGLAVARPYVPAASWIPIHTSSSHRLILLDNSLSLRARGGEGRNRFDEARAHAEALLSSFPAVDRISFVTLATPAEAVPAQPISDRRIARERLASIAVTEGTTDVSGAVDRTLEILKDSPALPGNRFVYLISDLQRGLWLPSPGGATTSATAALRRLADALPDPATQLAVIQVGSADENLAITSLASEASLLGTNLPVPITATIHNFGAVTARGMVLEIRLQTRIVRREPLAPLAPGATATVGLTLEFKEPGSEVIEARLMNVEDDGLSQDNARFQAVEIRPTTDVLIVDGRPGTTRLGGNSGFLVTAMDPRADAESQGARGASSASNLSRTLSPKIISEAELDDEILPDYAVVVLCNVSGLAPDAWSHLTRFVSAGGGLLVFLGDQVNSENYNVRGHEQGNGVIPAMLGRPTDAVVSGDSPDDTAGIGIKLERFTHPVLAEWTSRPNSGLFLARITRYIPATPDANRAEVLLKYTNEQPALITAKVGDGRVALFTTSANMDWTNLPAKGDFVPVLVNLVGFLAPRSGGQRNLAVGETILEAVSAVQSSLPWSLTAPDGGSPQASLVPHESALALRYGPVPASGVYTLAIGSELKRFASNVDTAESQIAPAAESDFRRAIDRPFSLRMDTAQSAERAATPKTTELGRTGLYVVLALLMTEMILAMAFHRKSAGDTQGMVMGRST